MAHNVNSNAVVAGNDGVHSVHSVQFLVNNAVVPLLTHTFGGMLLTAQNGTVSCEIVNIP